MTNEDFYKILGVSETANESDIKKAYRKLASKHHPDKGGNTEVFQKIQEAYSTLSDQQKRAEYDHIRKYGNASHGFKQHGPFSNPFSGMSGFHFGDFDINGMDDFIGKQYRPFKQKHSNNRKNKDLKITIPVSLKDTLKAHKKTIEVKTTNRINSSTIVEIDIPRGVNNKTTIRYQGLGDNLFENLPRGDLIVNFIIVEDPNFAIIDEINLLHTVNISVLDAIIGTNINITTLDGIDILLHVKPGTQSSTKLRIKHHGLYKENASSESDRGHLLVQLNIQVPCATINELLAMKTEEIVNFLKNKETK